MPIWECFASGFLFLGLKGVSRSLAMEQQLGILGCFRGC